MHLSLFIIDSQQSFDLSQWLVDGIERIIGRLMSVVADERHDKFMTLFENYSDDIPFSDDHGLIPADRGFIKRGYGSRSDEM